MKFSRGDILATTIAGVFLLLVGCGGGGGGGGGGGSTLSSISVNPLNPSIAVGATQQFTATGTYSDSSTKDITSSATWTSSDTAIATISASGLATSVSTGTTTITATLGSVSGSATLIVTSSGGGGSGASATIGAAGGSLTSSDGRISLQVPAGALSADTTVSIDLISNNAPQGVGLAYRLLPDGLTFNTPAALILHYTDNDVEPGNEPMLGIAFKDGQGGWQGLTSGTLDTQSKTLSVLITHFSDWAIYEAYRIGPPKDTLLTNNSRTFRVFTVGPPLGHSGSTAETIPLAPLGVVVQGSNWSVNGVIGGTSVVGQVLTGLQGEGLYTAPSKMPQPSTVAVSARVTVEDLTDVLLVASERIVARDWGLKLRFREAWICGGGNIASYTHDSPAYIIFHLGDDFQIAGYDPPSPLPQSLTDDGICPEYAPAFATVTTGERTRIHFISGGYNPTTGNMHLSVTWWEPDYPHVLVVYEGSTVFERPLTPGYEASNPVIIPAVYGAEIGPFGGGDSLQYVEIYWNLYEP